jgi:hypothetical protein
VDDATVEKLVRHWDEGWNTPDLATIMAPFAPGVVFSSPFVPQLTGDPARTTIDGADALRSYLEYALQYAGDIRYTVDATYVGPETLVLVYTCHNPDGTKRLGSDSMRVDRAGRVVEWRCHYPRADPVQSAS